MTMLGWLTTREIKEIFADEIETASGRMSDVFDDGARIFLRAVLAGEKQVQPRDRVQGGVAVCATSEDIWVHPYVFRQVCSNGAIRRTPSRPERSGGLTFRPSNQPKSPTRCARRSERVAATRHLLREPSRCARAPILGG